MAAMVIPASALSDEIPYPRLTLHSSYSPECDICRAVQTQLLPLSRKMLDTSKECHLKANVLKAPRRAKFSEPFSM